MCRKQRRLGPAELDLLAKLWPTSMPDKEMAAVFGMGRGSLRRVAAERLHLPCRTYARSVATAKYKAMMARIRGTEAA